MKKLLLAAVLMVLAGPVWAQETFVHGQSGNPGFRVGTFVGGMASDSTGYILPMTSGGAALYTSPYSPDRDAYYEELCLTTALTAIGDVDSSAVMDVSGYALTGLAFSASGDCDLLVQVRYCLGGLDDSTHTFPVVMVTADSASAGLVAGRRIAKTTAAGGPSEFRVPLYSNNALYGPNRRAYVRLADMYGADIGRVQYISIRVRYALRTSTAANTVSVWAVGSALR